MQKKVVIEFSRETDVTAVFKIRVVGEKVPRKILRGGGGHAAMTEAMSLWAAINLAPHESAAAALARLERAA